MKAPADPQNVVFVIDDDASLRESLSSLLHSFSRANVLTYPAVLSSTFDFLA
jgi:FixJ family two-component response regulator